jgi:hypothetical protein
MYAPDAKVTVADRITPPGAPPVLHGRDEIRAWIEDISARDMSHAVQHVVQDENRAARCLRRVATPTGPLCCA